MQRNKGVLIFAGVFALIAVVTISWLFNKNQTGNQAVQNGTTTSSTTDSGNGSGALQQTSSATQTGPQQAKTASVAYPVSGTEELYKKGVSSQQLDALTVAFANYFQGQNIPSATISISDSEHVLDSSGSTTTQLMYFNARTNHGTFKARMEYYNLVSIRLYLFDGNNKQVFDSKALTGN